MGFEDIRERVTDLAQAGAAKAVEIAEITKLKVSSAAEEDAIRKACTEIGRKYYAQRGQNPEEPYAALCAKIAAAREKIEANKRRIADIRAAGNITDEDLPEEEPAAEPAAPAEGERQ